MILRNFLIHSVYKKEFIVHKLCNKLINSAFIYMPYINYFKRDINLYFK